MEPNGSAGDKRNDLFPRVSRAIIPWAKEAEFQAPEQSSLRPPNVSSNGAPISESEANSVIDDLGDAKQLAQTRDRGHFRSASEATVLISHTGASFQDTTNYERSSSGYDILSQPEPFGETAKDSVVKAKTNQVLARKIRAALKRSSWENEEKTFLPLDVLESIITKEAIHEELRQQGSDVSLVDMIWEAERSRTSSLTTRRKIFAILVLIGEVPAITNFIEQCLYDKNLPFDFRDGVGDREGSYNVYLEVKNPSAEAKYIELEFFHKWEDKALQSFDVNQWQLLAPYFQLVSMDNPKVSHYKLPSRIVLPFIEDTIVDEPPAQHGGSADVRRVKIHHAHQNLWISGDEAKNHSYAVKRLHSPDSKAFEHEVETLKRFSGKNQHHHLINLLLTYQYRGHYHLLFHWADGNLLDYWEKQYPDPNYPVRDEKFAKWVCRQWLGIVEGLQAVHTYTSDPSLSLHDTQDPSDPRIHGRHGDLKPENILRFKGFHSDHNSPDYFGSFVISDFGLTTFHREKSKSRVNPENLGRSHTYRPPEYDVLKEVSQKSDMWSLGCVLLEFLHWYLLGWEGVKNFQNCRMADGASPEFSLDDYFTFVEENSLQKKTVFKKSVQESFQKLHSDPGTTLFTTELLDLVKNKLLRMNPINRANCGEIVECFREFNAKCLGTEGYCTQRSSKPRRASTDLSELMATPPTPSSRDTRNQFDMTSIMESRDMVNSVVKAQSQERRSSRQNASAHRVLEKSSGADIRPTYEARKMQDSQITAPTTPISEGINMTTEQDVQVSQSKKVHFVAEDSGISMNTNSTKSSHFGQPQNGEGIPSDNNDEGIERQRNPSLKQNFAVQTPVNPADKLQQSTTERANTNLSTKANASTEALLTPDESVYLRTFPEEHASTTVRPARPREVLPPNASLDNNLQVLEDKPSRPVVTSKLAYEESSQDNEHLKHSSIKNGFSQLFRCFRA